MSVHTIKCAKCGAPVGELDLPDDQPPVITETQLQGYLCAICGVVA